MDGKEKGRELMCIEYPGIAVFPTWLVIRDHVPIEHVEYTTSERPDEENVVMEK